MKCMEKGAIAEKNLCLILCRYRDLIHSFIQQQLKECLCCVISLLFFFASFVVCCFLFFFRKENFQVVQTDLFLEELYLVSSECWYEYMLSIICKRTPLSNR